jgi:hypothetical protein
MKSRQRGLNKPPGGLEEPWERSQQRFFKKWIDNPDRTDAEIYAEIDKEDEPISRRVIRG